MKTFVELKKWFEMYPPESADGKGWKDFDRKCKKEFPIRYWLNETLIPNVWWPVSKFFNSIRNWIRFRFFERMHIINTKLKPEYYECDTILLHGMFSILVDFVEIEKAWMQAICVEKYKKPWYPFKRFRNKEWGLKYLEWEMTLTGEDQNPSQANAAEEITNLYNWWTIQRPTRMDPYDLMDDKLFPPDRNFIDMLSSERTVDQMQVCQQIDDLEKQYDDEDTEMLIRLIKLRGSLWT